MNAEDILHDSFLKIYNARKTIDKNKDIRPWMKTITINTALNFLRKEKKLLLTEHEGYFEDVSEEPDDGYLYNKEDLYLALEKLPQGYKTIFSLYAIDNLTHIEIAKYLDISVGTSKSQFHRAKKMIKAELINKKHASVG